MERYIKLLFVALLATISFALTSCGDDNDEPNGLSFGKININGKDYACYGYGMPITYCSTWENGSLDIYLPMGELADANKGEYDYDYMITISCHGGGKPSTGTNLADYSDISATFLSMEWDEYFGEYVSGSAIVKSVKDDDYITIEFNNFKVKSSSQSYTINGTVKLLYDVD